MNERQDGLQEIIDATLREMAAEGAKGSTHWQFSPRYKLTICAGCILIFLLFKHLTICRPVLIRNTKFIFNFSLCINAFANCCEDYLFDINRFSRSFLYGINRQDQRIEPTSSYSFAINITMHFSTLAKILPRERLLKSLKHFNLSFHVKSHLYIPVVSYIEIYRFI